MRLSLIAGFVVSLTGGLEGQADPGGIWFGAGFGGATSKVGCDLCRGDWEFGPAVQVRFGANAGDFIRYGVEVNGWAKNDEALAVRDMMLGVGAVVYWFPNPEQARYYVKGGFGPLFYRAQESDVADGDTADPAITSTSFAGHFGVGYELGRGNFSVIPFFNITASLFANLQQDGTELTSVKLNVLQIGMAVQRR